MKLPIQGSLFTWSCGDGVDVFFKRLGYFLASISWLSLFPNLLKFILHILILTIALINMLMGIGLVGLRTIGLRMLVFVRLLVEVGMRLWLFRLLKWLEN